VSHNTTQEMEHITLLKVQNLAKLSDYTTNKEIRFIYVTNLVTLVNVVTVQRGRKIQFFVDNVKECQLTVILH